MHKINLGRYICIYIKKYILNVEYIFQPLPTRVCP
jgi:hypothetical protein